MAMPNNDAGKSEDAIEMLKADHQKVRELFQKYVAASDQHAKRQVADQVFVELETHAQLEEMVFYPAFEEAADDEGKQLVEEARQEHQKVKSLIAELRGLDADAAFDTKFRQLMDNVEHHVQEEETEIFPEAEEILAEDNEDLVDEMQEIKAQLLAS
jgi:hemerythrin superfamily protein